MSENFSFNAAWEAPHYDNIPAGEYDVTITSVETDYTNSGKMKIEIKAYCASAEYLDAPMNMTIWPESKFGVSQLKGIISRILAAETPDGIVRPSDHLKAGTTINDVINFLRQKLTGAVVTFRREMGEYNGQPQAQHWFHAVGVLPQAATPVPPPAPATTVLF